MPDGYVLDKPVSLSCPDCGGVLRPDNRSGIRQFRCTKYLGGVGLGVSNWAGVVFMFVACQSECGRQRVS